MSADNPTEYKVKTTPQAVNVANMILDSGPHDFSGRDKKSRALLAHTIHVHSPDYLIPSTSDRLKDNSSPTADSSRAWAHHPVMHEIIKDRLIDAGTKLKNPNEFDDYLGNLKDAFTDHYSSIMLTTEQQHKIANTFHNMLTHPAFNSEKYIKGVTNYDEHKTKSFSHIARDRLTDPGVRQKFYNTLDAFENVHNDKNSRLLAATIRGKMVNSNHANLHELKTNYTKLAEDPLKFNFITGLEMRGASFHKLYENETRDPKVWKDILNSKNYNETQGYMQANIHEGLRTISHAAQSYAHVIGSDKMADFSAHVVNLLENHPTFKSIMPNSRNEAGYLPGGVYSDTAKAHISRFEDILQGSLNHEKLESNAKMGRNHLTPEEHTQLKEKAKQMIRMRIASRNI